METNAKRRSALWALFLAGAFWVVVGAGPVPAYAQKSPAITRPAGTSDELRRLVEMTRPSDHDNSSVDAQRGAFDRFLDSHPEIANYVVANPTVMGNPKYLQMHPELQAFLDSHAQVKADPRAFVSPREWRNEPPSSGRDSIRDPLMVVALLGCPLLAVLWVLRTLVENRRWNLSFKMHEQLHTKLIEKFASGQDFSAYLQSDAGRRLLEWTPPVTDTTSRGLPNPIGRIFWSLQAGLLLLLVGLGLLPLRGHIAVSDAPPLLVLGTLGVTLGAGFILSALVSYGLSKHLGLIGGAVQGSDAMVKH